MVWILLNLPGMISCWVSCSGCTLQDVHSPRKSTVGDLYQRPRMEMDVEHCWQDREVNHLLPAPSTCLDWLHHHHRQLHQPITQSCDCSIMLTTLTHTYMHTHTQMQNPVQTTAVNRYQDLFNSLVTMTDTYRYVTEPANIRIRQICQVIKITTYLIGPIIATAIQLSYVKLKNCKRTSSEQLK